MRSVACFFKKLLRSKKTGEVEIDVITVVSLSALGSAGSQHDDGRTEPQPVVPAAPVRSLRGSDSFADHSFPQPPPIAQLGVTVTAEGHTCFGDPRKMARVVEWLNETAKDINNSSSNSEDNAEGQTHAADDIKEDSGVHHLSGMDCCDASLPSPPPSSALTDEEDEPIATPIMLNEACCLVNDVEEVSRNRLFSMNQVRRVLGMRQRAPRGRASNRHVTGRRGVFFPRVLGSRAAVPQ